MKLYILSAIISLAAARPGGKHRINDAADFVAKENPINAQNMRVLTRYAGNIERQMKVQAKKYGVELDFSEVGDNLNKNYRGQAEKFVGDQEKNVKQGLKKLRENKNFKKVNQIYQNATPQRLLNRFTNQLNKQLGSVANEDLKRDLKNMLQASKKAAQNELRSQGIATDTLEDTGEDSYEWGLKFINANKDQWAKDGNKMANKGLKQFGKWLNGRN